MAGCVAAARAEQLFSENFDSLSTSLQAFQSPTESGGDGTDWTAAPPDGWIGDNSGVPAGGVTEFAGWTFLDPVSWNASAGQDRDQFTKGTNVVAVADGDEWDDSGPGARMETVLTTPAIALNGAAANSVLLKFDSSWRTEPQNGKVSVTFDGGDAVDLLLLDNATPDQLNETIVLEVGNPAGATAMAVTFTYEAGNNWWWAIDNIEVVSDQPVFTVQPSSGELAVGAELTLTVSAVGTSAVTYQWYKGAGTARAAIEGATSATFMIAAVDATDAGIYSVTATAGGATTSMEASVTVIDSTAEKQLLSENFDSLTLEAFSSSTESGGDGTDWTATLPSLWTRDNLAVPTGGVPEFAGWTFLDPVSWNATAGQDRNLFTKGQNVIAVADGDEWDDSDPGPAEPGRMLTLLSTPSLPLTGMGAGSVVLKFDSSWRTEPQNGKVEVSYDGGTPQELLVLNSDTPDELDKTYVLVMDHPAGAAGVVVSFSYEAGNNWWWALDNIEVSGNKVVIVEQPAGGEFGLGQSATLSVAAVGGELSYQWYKDDAVIEGATGASLALDALLLSDTGGYRVDISNTAGDTMSSVVSQLTVVDPDAASTLFAEDFDSLELGPFVSETESGGDGTDWTDTLPANWMRDNSAVPAGGVPEFAGWTFLDPVSWNASAGQDRDQFTKGRNVVAVADGDEWDDSSPGARMQTLLTTPAISLDGVSANSVTLQFDSSWRTEPQTGIVKIAFDGGEPVTVLTYTSESPSELNESVVLPIDNPAGASSMQVSFDYEAGNNWWWALDNIRVTGNAVVIVEQPVAPEGGVDVGSGFNLAVVAHGGELTYQWFKGTGEEKVAIPGATGSNYSIAAAISSDAGVYSVEVMNSLGSTVTTDEFTVAVNYPLYV